jgi:hypothetical protein
MTLPPPTTFAEGQRKLFGLLMAAAGVAYSIAVLCGVALVVWGSWPPELARLRLLILAGAIGGGTIGSIAVTLALAVGGPVGRFSVEADEHGAKFSVEDHASPSPSVTTTTTVTPAATGGVSDPAARP